jgi:hypothetical protein
MMSEEAVRDRYNKLSDALTVLTRELMAAKELELIEKLAREQLTMLVEHRTLETILHN